MKEAPDTVSEQKVKELDWDSPETEDPPCDARAEMESNEKPDETHAPQLLKPVAVCTTRHTNQQTKEHTGIDGKVAKWKKENSGTFQRNLHSKSW